MFPQRRRINRARLVSGTAVAEYLEGAESACSPPYGEGLGTLGLMQRSCGNAIQRRDSGERQQNA